MLMKTIKQMTEPSPKVNFTSVVLMVVVGLTLWRLANDTSNVSLYDTLVRSMKRDGEFKDVKRSISKVNTMLLVLIVLDGLTPMSSCMTHVCAQHEAR